MSHFQSPDATMMSDYTNASGPYLQGNASSRRSSTAYNGSEGLIGDNRSVASFDYAHDSEGLAVPESARTATRSNAGSRLWSTLSNNAQPAAAALSRKGSVL
ncbi:hypothetical protein KC319_g11559, partial [Hortaea werneckii]